MVVAINANSVSDFDLPKFIKFQLQTDTCEKAVKVNTRKSKLKVFLVGCSIGVVFSCENKDKKVFLILYLLKEVNKYIF